MRLHYSQILTSRRYQRATAPLNPRFRASNAARAERLLDQLIEALIALNCCDDEIALAFNASARKDIRQLRARAGLRYYPRPARDS